MKRILEISALSLFLLFAGCGMEKHTGSYGKGSGSYNNNFSYQALLSAMDPGTNVPLNRPAIAPQQPAGYPPQYSSGDPFAGIGAGAPQYGQQQPLMNDLLGFADYIHAADPSVIRLVRVTIGAQPGSVGKYSGVWDFNIQSDHNLMVLRAYQPEMKRYVQNTTLNQIRAHYELGYDGVVENSMSFIIGIKANNPNPACNGASSPQTSLDPFAQFFLAQLTGTQVSNSGLYYYYPPPNCPAANETISAVSAGSVTAGSGGQTFNPYSYQAAPPPQSTSNFNLDFSYLLNTLSAFAPYASQSVQAGGLNHQIQFRVVPMTSIPGTNW